MDAVADALGVPKESVVVYMRILREAGMITRKGRGRGAPRMELRDAVNLLLAVAGSVQPSQAVAAVEKFGPLQRIHRIDRLPNERHRPREWHRLLEEEPFFRRLSLRRIASGMSLQDALVHILDRLQQGELFPPWPGGPRPVGSEVKPAVVPYLRLRLLEPIPAAAIRWGLQNVFQETLSFGTPLDNNLDYLKTLSSEGKGGRTIAYDVYLESFSMIADAISR